MKRFLTAILIFSILNGCNDKIVDMSLNDDDVSNNNTFIEADSPEPDIDFPECFSGTVKCSGRYLMACQNNGWVIGEDCGKPAYCINGSCIKHDDTDPPCSIEDSFLQPENNNAAFFAFKAKGPMAIDHSPAYWFQHRINLFENASFINEFHNPSAFFSEVYVTEGNFVRFELINQNAYVFVNLSREWLDTLLQDQPKVIEVAEAPLSFIVTIDQSEPSLIKYCIIATNNIDTHDLEKPKPGKIRICNDEQAASVNSLRTVHMGANIELTENKQNMMILIGLSRPEELCFCTKDGNDVACPEY